MKLEIPNLRQPEDSIRAVLHTECMYARRLIDEQGDAEPHATIHEIRRSFKKIRAILRLSRDATDAYVAENRFFRDEARKISDIRDSEALLEALTVLERQHGDRLYNRAFADLRKALEKERDALAHVLLDQKDLLAQIGQNLESRAPNLAQLPLEIDSFSSLGKAVGRTYARGRKAFGKALETKDPDDFHEWRKRIKYLRYQLLALAPIWPGILEAWEEELHRLSDFLGTERDLYLLQHFMTADRQDTIGTEDGRFLTRALIDTQREQLQQHALLLGEKLFHLKRKRFISLLATAWKSRLAIGEKGLLPPGNLER